MIVFVNHFVYFENEVDFILKMYFDFDDLSSYGSVMDRFLLIVITYCCLVLMHEHSASVNECVRTCRQSDQVVPPDVQVPQGLQLTHLRRQRLDLIAAHVL